jgi:hypothetical protein
MIPRPDSQRETDRRAEPATSPVEPDRAAEPTTPITTAMTLLDGLQHRPPHQHVEAFERVHQALTDALSAIDGV